MDDLAKRIADRIEVTTDGYSGDVGAVDMSFGEGIDFAKLVKVCGHELPTPTTTAHGLGPSDERWDQ